MLLAVHTENFVVTGHSFAGFLVRRRIRAPVLVTVRPSARQRQIKIYYIIVVINNNNLNL